MATSSISGFGTTLTRGTDAAPIAELIRIGSPELTVETIDVTNHQSEEGFKEFIGSLTDVGSVPIEGNFISGDAGQMGLYEDLLSKTAQDFVITFPDGTTWTFKALVVAFKIGEATVNGQLTFSADLKVSGKPVLAPSEVTP